MDWNAALRNSALLSSSVKRRPETLRPLQTQWAFGWRCVPKMNLTCTHFQSAEVQSFFQPAPTFSFTHTVLTVGFDPGNVIQMSCVMGATAFTEEVEKSAHCMRTGATGTLIFHRRGQREWNAFSRNCFFFHKFIFKFLCRTLHPKKGKKPSEMLCVFVIHSLNVEIPGHQSC